MNVTVVTVHHRHGEDIFVGENMKAAMTGLEDYCREWLADFATNDEFPEYIDTDGKVLVEGNALVEAYFQLAGEEEYYDSTTVDVIPAVPA